MVRMNPYLNFDGNTEEAFNFYRSVFGGEFVGGIHRMGEAPGMDGLAAGEKNRVMHISLPIGNGATLMASDTLPSAGHVLHKGNNVHISLHPDSREEADRLFAGLSAGGQIVMALTDTFWGSYFGTFIDKFGISWMINYAKEA
ncbi:MAG: VOC family protein [Sphingobacteriales bacterium]|nr:VOC family protein [Sphingobacteriales bacterium]OJW30970.1 MAG: VOC family protein [Sphingobacteriales bacterium 46-32]